LYDYFGYHSLFYYCAGLAILDLIMRVTLINDKKIAAFKAQTMAALAERQQAGEEFAPPSSVSMWTLVKYPPIFSACICVLLSSSVIMGLDIMFPVYLTDAYGATPSIIGIAWSASIIPNLIMAWVCGQLTSRVSTKLLLGIGSILLGISSALLAFPGNVPGIPRDIVLQICLFAFLAIGEELILVVSLPDMGKSAENFYGDNNAKIYGIWNAAYGMGMIVGPMAGGYAYEKVGFLYSMSFIGGCLVVFSVAPMTLYLKARIAQSKKA